MTNTYKCYRKVLPAYVLLVLGLVGTLPALAQRPEPLAPDSDEVEMLPVQGNIYVIATGGSNIAVQVTDHGTLMVDSGNIEAAENVVRVLSDISSLPPQYLINTSVLPGHIAGNEVIKNVGSRTNFIGQNGDFDMTIFAHNNGVMMLASNFIDDVSFELWPNNTFFGARKDISFNGEAIEMLHQPAAITASDIIVHFRDSDVLVVGDILDLTSYPHFYPELGGSLQGEIDALNRIIDITVPELNQQGGTLVIPGHGRIASESDVVEYRDMLSIIRDRVSDMIAQGLSFEEVLARRPALEYDGIYGRDSGDWTSRMFLEAVYEDLQ